MDVKPPVMIAVIVAALVILVGAFVAYDKHQKAAMNASPPLSRSRYLPPPVPPP